jgi:hypothetical protein
VKVEQHFHFAFLDKWLYFAIFITLFLDYKMISSGIALAGGLMWQSLR